MVKFISFLCLLTTLQSVGQQITVAEKDKSQEFNFWVGHWEVYQYGTDKLAGESHIEPIIDSLGLLEHYKAHHSGFKGKSLNTYNSAKGRWEQYWIDNTGLSLFLVGGMKDGRMEMDDLESGNAKTGYNRISWEEQEDGTVRQTWSISKDSGTTWTIIFDGIYRPKK
ncbi:MAG: hypothetical protein R3299_06415 [Arenibacter sp.]|uniref:hypothetical protein n=1 Tax=Arenibacter TaxID=178469 RepID=UPI001124942C|nr:MULTISPECIES: hypothetical protein [Arenibacter]MDX1327322.1 hypothetical protein [Arenibacter sp.]